MKTRKSTALTQPENRQNHQNDNDEPYEINDIVHQ